MFEGIDPKALGAVRALAREMRYRERSDLLGRRVLIDSVDSIDRAVRAAVPEIPSSAELGTTRASLTLAKYGLLDLAYRVRSIEAPVAGFRTLRAMGLLEREPDEAPEQLASTHSYLFDWLEECRESAGLIKLFLHGPSPRNVVASWERRGRWRGNHLGDYLPQELTIVDACETNCGDVWLGKHFYL